jgi:hypothetical protein
MRVRTGAKAVRTGQVFLVRKVILEFSTGPSGQANVSVRMPVRTEVFRTLLITFQTLKLHNFFLAFQRRRFHPNPIFE